MHKKISNKLLLYLLIAVLSFLPILASSQQVFAQTPAEKTGYHLVYCNNHSWSEWGASLKMFDGSGDACTNPRADTITRTCYHYLDLDIITSDLYYLDDDTYYPKSHTYACSDGTNWTLTGEKIYAHYEGSTCVATPDRKPNSIWSGKKHVRLFKFTASCKGCEWKNMNGKYLKNTAYYAWGSESDYDYGLNSVLYYGAWGSGNTISAVKVPDQPSYYHYFMNKNNLAGEQKNSRNEYPTYDCAMNNKRSRGIIGYDASGNPVWSDDSYTGYVWQEHVHEANRYICDGHLVPNTYTVSYDGNGATGGSTQSTAHIYDEEAALAVNGFTKTNYTFIGWSSNPGGSVEYENGRKVKNLSAANGAQLTLYAVWRPDNYDVKVVDKIDGTDGAWLGENIVSIPYGDTVSGSVKGSDVSDNAYYNGYYYDSCTSANITGPGAVVYRIFKLRTVDITGAINWNDKSNYYNSRPDASKVHFYRDGIEVYNASIAATADSVSYSWPSQPKYSTTDGHAFSYTVSQDHVVSKNNDDQYSTVQNGFVFNNNLQNNGKFAVSGAVTWQDNFDKLKFRPDNVQINLYRNGEKVNQQTLDAVDTGYSFSNLDKFDAGLNPYTYTAQEEFYAKVMEWNSSIHDYVLVDAYKIDVNGLNFTNTLINRIYVKPDRSNQVSVRLDFKDCNWDDLDMSATDVVIPCQFKKLTSHIQDGEIIYGTDYENFEVKANITQEGTTINSLSAGKYEIVIPDGQFEVADIQSISSSNVILMKENDKTYLVVGTGGASADIVVTVTAKKHTGYQTYSHLNNYFKPWQNYSFAVVSALSMYSDDIVVPDPEEFTVSYFIGKELLQEEKYLETTNAVITGCDMEEFIGWAETPDGRPVYIEGDMIEVLKDMNLYAIFRNMNGTVSGNGIE